MIGRGRKGEEEMSAACFNPLSTTHSVFMTFPVLEHLSLLHSLEKTLQVGGTRGVV